MSRQYFYSNQLADYLYSMKNSIKIVPILFLLFVTVGSSFAQSASKEHQHLLSLHHKKAQDDHDNVAQHKTAKPSFRRMEAKDARISINAARATHREMLKETPEQTPANRQHHKKMASLHKKAIKHNDALDRELTKDTPDEQKVQAHIDAVKHSLVLAEKENQSLAADSTRK